jgi:hypothetical protein
MLGKTIRNWLSHRERVLLKLLVVSRIFGENSHVEWG